jgi:hypothetical protein
MVMLVDAMLKQPGLGEWYVKPGMNKAPGFYKSEHYKALLSHLTARGEGIPWLLSWAVWLLPLASVLLFALAVRRAVKLWNRRQSNSEAQTPNPVSSLAK